MKFQNDFQNFNLGLDPDTLQNGTYFVNFMLDQGMWVYLGKKRFEERNDIAELKEELHRLQQENLHLREQVQCTEGTVEVRAQAVKEG